MKQAYTLFNQEISTVNSKIILTIRSFDRNAFFCTYPNFTFQSTAQLSAKFSKLKCNI